MSYSVSSLERGSLSILAAEYTLNPAASSGSLVDRLGDLLQLILVALIHIHLRVL